MNTSIAPRCWFGFCRLPIEDKASSLATTYKLTGERIEVHRECMERVRRSSAEAAVAREEFATKRIAGFVSSLPEFRVRHDDPEFAARVTHPRLVAAAERYEIKHGNLALVGPSGCGKSTVAAAIALGRAESAVRAYCATGGRDSAQLDHALGMRWTTAAELCAARKQHKLGAGEAPEIELAETATLLFLDEIGQEIADDRWLLEFLNVRYARKLPTITTSGLAQSELENRYGIGAYRRLIEPHGVVIDLFAGSKPRLIATEQRVARGG